MSTSISKCKYPLGNETKMQYFNTSPGVPTSNTPMVFLISVAARSRGTYLYSITLQDSPTPNPICLMAKATSSQAWLWHHRLSHLNFNAINLLSKNNIVKGLQN
ncbi:retrovirus-related pol polyprotein from transposon TNT 1-94 [Tanacetum coccineum]